MKPYNYYDVGVQRVSYHGNSILKFEGVVSGDATVYLQLFDSFEIPTSASTPLKVWKVTGGAEFYKEFKNGELAFAHGMYVAVSDTADELDPSDSTITFSIELSSPDSPVGTTIVGETGQSEFLFVEEQNGPVRLYQFHVVNGAGACCLQLLTIEGPVGGETPFRMWPLAANADLYFDFGPDGLLVQSVVDGVMMNSLHMFLSSDPETLVPVEGGEVATIFIEHS